MKEGQRVSVLRTEKANAFKKKEATSLLEKLEKRS